ncbi:putative HicB family RNase H-like nuclease [Azospirillum fermentarium]|uniref:type II toxin-antitoxin system HicB family antitoxin n=1 Tax=Azospirillum fermentarium TaxID=1233114 RepID=UPI002225C54E|nr:type II toxin-antitoxin system HicB family antitoxin [Azospirillum fermentarium]MCW2248279.1 putative HicB family RNase H-like nuclease [Azospirillum fermentarium]
MTMEYKGYVSGPIDFDPEDGTFSGTVAGLSDVIHFEGIDAESLLESFKGSIDEYLAICAEKGRTPDKPFSGKIFVRASSDQHRKAALRAAAEGISLSQWVARQIDAAP